METQQPVSGVQEWMTEFIIKNGICPPLASIYNQYQGNWETMQRVAPIISLHHLDATSPDLPMQAANLYGDFVRNVLFGSAQQNQLALTVILPDLKRNKAYDIFLGTVQYTWIMQILKESPDYLLGMFGRLSEHGGKHTALADVGLALIREGKTAAALSECIIDGAFRMIGFYGRPISKDEVRDLTSDRGPALRQRTLSQAPYDLLQIVNPFDTGYETINKTRVHERNTGIALKELSNYGGFQEKMKRYKRS